MNVYFTASIAGKKQNIENYLKIIEKLRARGCDVICEHIIKSNESEIRMETREDRLKFHDQLEKWIVNCDFMVAETSFPSISVGYEISLSQLFYKPVLILYNTGEAPSLLAQHKDERVTCEKYTNENLDSLIEDFINFVKGTNDSRFTFFITSKIAAYLDKVSKVKKIPKSVYLRNLIEGDMKNHK